MTCDKPTYVSSSLGEDGVWEFLAECDGQPDCGFTMHIPEDDIAEVLGNRLYGFAFTSEHVAAWDRYHREVAGRGA